MAIFIKYNGVSELQLFKIKQKIQYAQNIWCKYSSWNEDIFQKSHKLIKYFLIISYDMLNGRVASRQNCKNSRADNSIQLTRFIYFSIKESSMAA